MKLTQGLVFATNGTIQPIPFEETTDCSLPNVYFQIASHQQDPHEVQADVREFRKLVVHIERRVKSLCLGRKLRMSALKVCKRIQDARCRVPLFNRGPSKLEQLIGVVYVGL